MYSVAHAAEDVVHAPPMEVRPTGSTGLWLGVVLGPQSQVALSSVSRSCNQPYLPTNVFGSPDHDEDLADDALAPVELHLVCGSSSFPHSSLGAA